MRQAQAHYNRHYFEKFRNHSRLRQRLLDFVDRKEPVYSYLLRNYPAKSKLLDVGCGAGWFLRQASAHFECLGLDISKEALEMAKEQAPRAKFKKLSIYELNKLKTNQFDVITCFDTLEHVIDHQQIFSQFFRLLTPTGQLLISAPNAASISLGIKKTNWFGFKDPSHLWFLTPRQWGERFTRAGFIPLSVWVNGMMDPPYFKWLPLWLQILAIKYPTQLWSLVGGPMPVWAGETFFMLLTKNPGWVHGFKIQQESLAQRHVS